MEELIAENKVGSENVSNSSETKTPRISVLKACASKFEKRKIQSASIYDHKIGSEWDVDNNVCVDFIEIIERKFASNNKYHGYFNPGSEHIAPGVLKGYLSESLSFERLVSSFMAEVCKVANENGRSGLSEGHLVFTHYKTAADQGDFGRLLVVMLGQKTGFDFDSELVPKSTSSLNMDDFRQAALFDLTLFDVGFPANDGEEYLKFIKGRSRSDFLKPALGCGDYIPNKVSLENLQEIITEYLGAAGLTRGTRAVIRRKIEEHLNRKAKDRVPVNLADVQSIIDSELPLESELRSKFCNYVNNSGLPISDSFEPTVPDAKRFNVIKLDLGSGDLLCSVKLEAITVGDAEDNADIVIDENFTRISFKIPDGQRELFSKLLNEVSEE